MLAIGSDHRGFALKTRLRQWLQRRWGDVCDLGAFSTAPVDYPDVAIPAAEVVRDHLVDGAILICGTGLGMAIAANKVPGVFAATVTDVATARAARRSNNAQILCLGAESVSFDLAAEIVEAWLTTEFQGGDSLRKLAKIRAAERRYAR
ncbi:MAG: RpiB/LacA/LacB family sugar-phosphate isomerase [Armatimonadetes bacterium]|nr:RpiB/LacA/LacB family sugar-phosphate isomerase [Armatimonadota bacterium]